MSEQIKHECGIAFVRLLKPLEYYLTKYGTAFYGLNKLYLLMEKQHNRGHDGAGIANVKFGLEPGNRYINRLRSNSSAPIKDIFNQIFTKIQDVNDRTPERLNDVNWLKKNFEFTGELFVGHLRYGTFGKNDIDYCHPFVRHSNRMTKNLVIAGNFNLTNVDELFNNFLETGQHPIETSDTVTVLEQIGNVLDDANDEFYKKYSSQGLSDKENFQLVAQNLDIQSILSKSSCNWDGGYVIAGMMGHGDGFVMRDPSGIRPAYYYYDDEIVIATSERPAIQTAFNVPFESIKELPPAHALIVKKDGKINVSQICEQHTIKACSFERIYFSRGTDKEIYNERKMLGSLLTPAILEAIDYNLADSVFSYIPNTASVAFYGLYEALNSFCDEVKKDKLIEALPNLTKKKADEILSLKPRVEKVAVKDAKLRTFITEDQQRDDLVAHIYDVTYGSVRKGVDTLVVLDDSIVRGTTLKQSIIRILDRLGPKKIIITSSAPQIRYPDCYGIDMAKLGDFIAFKAAIELLKETNQSGIINQVYQKAKAQENLPKEQVVNHVKEIYKPFSPKQISEKISQLLTPPDIKADVQIVYQTIEDLHKACPKNLGDWYFTGDYPTPGGNKVVNRSFINYIEGKNERAY